MILKDIHKFKVKCEPVNTAMIDFQESKFIIGKHWYLFIFFFLPGVMEVDEKRKFL